MALKFGRIEQTIFIKASPNEVYDALLNARKHTAFTGSQATTSAKVGAEFTAWDGYILGKNLALVRGQKIVQEWETTEWPEGYPRSRLEFTLTPRKEGTQLKMVHSQVPAEQVEEYRTGWHTAYWGPLKEYFATKKTQR